MATADLTAIIDEEFRRMYLEHIREDHPARPGRPRYRNPMMYEKVEQRDSVLRFDDVDKAKVWVWSDQHFWHKNIIPYSDRPYGSLEHMHQELLANYKLCVKDDDICIWVGDIAFCKDSVANAMLAAYPGYKILVAGNHDFEKKRLKRLQVEEVHLTLTIRAAEDLYVCFSHFPMEDKMRNNEFFINLGVDVYNVHGHTHDRNTGDPRLFNVSVENIDYMPHRTDAIVRAIEGQLRGVWGKGVLHEE